MTGWLQELSRHDAIAAAVIAGITSIALALIAWVSGAGKWIAGEISKSLEERRKRRSAERALPKKTLLIVEDLTTVPPHSWRIRNHNQNGDATGFRALLFLTRTENYGNVTITSTEARLPWRLRRKHRVVGALYQAARPHRELREVVTQATEQGAVNFYVQPPISTSRPIHVTIRLRDQYSNWQERTVSFTPEPTTPSAI